MDQVLWTAVDKYFSKILVGDDPVMEEVLKTNAAEGLPPWDVSVNQGKLLQLLAQTLQARQILEIGTLGAYSTIWMARALPKDGKIISLEFDPKYAEVALSNIRRAGFADIVEVRVGKALDTLPRLLEESRGPFDLIFIDADKNNNANYFSWAIKLSRPGTMIIVDNVVRNGSVIDTNSKDPSIQGVQRLNEMLSRETRVSATAIQTVGTKGWDGFILAIVKV